MTGLDWALVIVACLAAPLVADLAEFYAQQKFHRKGAPR